LVRALTGLGLKESKDLVESDRPAIADDLTLTEAQALAKRFEDLATIAIEPKTAIRAP
jgi:ribosomal protein L7/L12